jgi:hypothetical protein
VGGGGREGGREKRERARARARREREREILRHRVRCAGLHNESVAFICKHMHTQTHIHKHVYIHTQTHIHKHVCIHSQTHIHTHTNTCLRVCVQGHRCPLHAPGHFCGDPREEAAYQQHLRQHLGLIALCF